MADAFGKVKPGDRTLSAAAWNEMLETVAFVRQLKRTGAGDSLFGRSRTTAKVKNTTGGTLARFAVVQLGVPLVTPTANLEEFQALPMMEATAPTDGTGRVAILAEPAEAGAIVSAVVSGAVACQVDVGSTGHGFATVVGGDTTKLQSTAAGPIRLLSGPTTTGVQWAYVLLQAGSATDAGDMACLEVVVGVTCDPDTNEPVIETRTIHFVGYVDDSGCGSGSGSGSGECLDGGADQPDFVNFTVTDFCGLSGTLSVPKVGDCAWSGETGTSITGDGPGAVFNWEKVDGTWTLTVTEDGVALAIYTLPDGWDGSNADATFVSGTGD
jgi:hypothetical protein